MSDTEIPPEALDGGESLNDDLAAAIDEHDEETPPEGEQPPVEGEQPPEGGEQPPAEGEQPPVEGEQPPEGGEQPPAEGEQPPAEGEQPPQALTPPEHWAPEHQQLFAELDPKAQAFLMDRHKAMEADYTKKTQEIAPMRQALEQWSPYLQQLGAIPEQHINGLMQVEYVLRTGTPEQKQQMLQGLAAEFGVPQPQGQVAPTPEEDPFGIQQQIQQALGPMAGQLQQLQQNFQTQGQQHQQQAVQTAQDQISEFRDAVGEDGRPLHPHFAELENDMTMLAQAEISAGHQPDLQTLYDRACWANPSVRAKMQAAESLRASHEAQEEAKRQAAKTEGANGSLSGGGGGPVKEQPKSLDEELAAAMEQHAA